MVSPTSGNAPHDIEFDLATPRAASLIESMRAFGYGLPSAIADLIDNSISAGASKIWVDFEWAGQDSIISVTDDGRGMNTEELVAAMRPGSKSPREVREPTDLGRFGLGLKTASFSQCRRVTVRSKSGEEKISTRCWDLDHVTAVNDWQLLRQGNEGAENHFHRLTELPHGTSVVWQQLDRLTAGQSTQNSSHQEHFLGAAKGVREHLSVVFHQVLTRESFAIYINNVAIEPWDPFLPNEPATQLIPTTPLAYRGTIITVRPFVLPHQSKITKATHAAAAGPKGWNAHQGFYVYRNNRLLVAGDWLGFGWAKEEHYKLARIAVDVPTSLDLDWSIDVTKSRATPPPALREDLRRIAERTRADAKRVYSHRGARLTQQVGEDRTLLWEHLSKHDKVFYRLNRSHPMIKAAIRATTDKPALDALLRLIEETVPYPHITITNSERPGSLPGPFEYTQDASVKMVMREAYNSLLSSGYGKNEAVNRLRTIWPFELFPAILQSLLEDKGND